MILSENRFPPFGIMRRGRSIAAGWAYIDRNPPIPSILPAYSRRRGKRMEVAIIGGGICGLSLALNLRQRGIDCCVYERAPEIKPLGVGITLLPHAMREFTALGVGEALLAAGIENRESCFFNRFGQLIYKEPRGKFAGYQYPEVGIHRGKLHLILYAAARKALGADAILLDHDCSGVEQDETAATLHFKGRDSVRADVVIACDGINSALRKQFYPNDKVAFAGINTWRGVTRMKPILGGRSYIRIGSILTGKMVVYPIVDNVDDRIDDHLAGQDRADADIAAAAQDRLHARHAAPGIDAGEGDLVVGIELLA